MLDIEIIRKNPEKVKEAMVARNKSIQIIDDFINLDKKWRELVSEIQSLTVEQKKLASEKKIDEAKGIKNKIKEKEDLLPEIEKSRYSILLEIPNIPFDDVKKGKNESENNVIKTVGQIPKFDFEVQDHMDLGEKLGIIDTKKASEASGSRFYYLKGKGALLEFALIRYAIDILTENGFEPVIVPVMIKPDVYEKMGRLSPSQRDERYYIGAEDLYLVGSGEHTLGPLQMNEVINEKDFPKRYVGFSSCFRKEAGSYGKDVKGILRVHQFDKVEMYVFSDPLKSEEEHKFMVSMQEQIYKGLDLPYQVVEICTGDMGPTDARQFDIEAWMPSQNKYREVASCSNTSDYQTRGINTKIKRGDNKTEYAHALNATAIAIGRTIIAILENNQNADGSISVPKNLQKYLGFDIIN